MAEYDDKNDYEEVLVRVWTDYGLEYDVKGVLSPGNAYCFVPKKRRLIPNPMILRTAKNKQIVYAPEQAHGNISWKFLVDLAKAQKYNIIAKWIKKEGDILKCDIKATGSIDPYIFNLPKIAPNFGADAGNIVRARFLEALLNLADRSNIFMALFGFFGGIFAGALMSLVAGAVF